MLPNISKTLLHCLEKHPEILNKISRGIERETLRINFQGKLAKTRHPSMLGSSLTHPWITTDFSESLLEFVTPKNNNINYIIDFLKDLHKYVAKNLKKELMWPFSMPCHIRNKNEIKIAKYGNSKIGKIKTLYRKGLKTRYGSLMQIISGIHYNFSFPKIFWKKIADVKKKQCTQRFISNSYLCLIRNYYRFGWIIPYLFGSSPAISKSFINDHIKNQFHFIESYSNTFYMPYATSLRLSDLGYTNINNINNIIINFNNLSDYIDLLKKSVKTPLLKYQKIGIKDSNGNYLQLNCNILQLESELYSLIKPKRKPNLNESVSDALIRDGIEYLEIRSLDLNPFSPIGITKDQIQFLDLFLVWCSLTNSPTFQIKDIFYIQKNWNQILLEGRKPGQFVFNKHKNTIFLKDIGREFFSQLYYIAKILDFNQINQSYQNVCNKLIKMFFDTELTYSGKILQKTIKNGINKLGFNLAKKHHNKLLKESFKILTEKDLIKKAKKSIIYQKKLEKHD